MTRIHLASLGIVGALGCAHRAAAPAATPTPPRADAPTAPAAPPLTTASIDPGGCPMDVPGARVALTVLDGAVALDFTTPGDVMELRRRVRALGDRASMHDLDHGARVTLAPVDRGRTEELEARASRAVFELNQGDCSSLEGAWLALVGPDVELRDTEVEVEAVRAMANRTPHPVRR